MQLLQSTVIQLAQGLKFTLGIFFFTLIFSIPLGLLVSRGRMSKVRIVSLIFQLYISILRGTPLMLQLLLVYFGPYYVFGVNLGSIQLGPFNYRFIATIIAFTLNYAAYFAEIFRGGIQSMSKGQYEAATVLGFSKMQTYFKIILPQVIKRVLPSVSNEIITLVKYYDGERPGESYAEGGQPDWHGACCGDVDVTGWRKPISHYREILWRSGESAMLTGSAATESLLYMAVREPDGYRGKINGTSWSVWPTWESWNWAGWEGKPVDVEVYTKAPEVTLYLNGREIGKKTVNRSTEYKAVFQVPYEPGTLRAEANGKSITLSTAGEPARLRLTADKMKLTADGQDLAFVIVEVVDSEGRICPDAAISCEAVVKGNGQLMAFASADLKDREPTVTPCVNTWKGRAMLVVRSAHSKGKIDVSVKSSLPTATLTIRTGLQESR